MHETAVVSFLANLLVILLSAKIFGELAERLGQPAVLGELLGGVVLGFGFVSFFHANDPVLTLMAEFGVVLLLLETGLESDLKRLLKVGPVSLAVAFVGVVFPFVAGWGAMKLLGHSGLEAVLIGAALTATSVGITARVLADLGKLNRTEAQIILGAAVIDDVIGVILLSAVQSFSASGQASWGRVAWTAFLALVFLGVALLIGPAIAKRLTSVIQQMRGRGALLVGAVCFAFAMALLAHSVGTALIVGSFTAGLLLAGTERKKEIHEALAPVSNIFVPVFFVMVGAKVDLSHYNPLKDGNWGIIGLAALLILIAIVTKIVSALAVRDRGLNRWGVGIGMVPRGEVGLIFAQIGLASQIIDQPLYAAVVGMVVVTTFVTPPLLKKSFGDS
jgi:Kef-type K+ transport system membrane component KefB